MSNHEGGYLVSDVLDILDEYKVFELLGTPQSIVLIVQIMKHGSHEYDCNTGEMISEELSDKLSFCYYCLDQQPGIEEGLCETCRDDEV